MPQAIFDIQLEQPLIISQQAASAGAHQSHDYVPGSTLLGLVASRLYATLTPDEAWLVFHSGHVRFADALPLSQSEAAFPVPLCWHTYKGEAAHTQQQLVAERLFDPSFAGSDPSRQPVQLRGGYVTLGGNLILPRRQQTLKTAIDQQSGMAAESQLFGYEALAAGQHYRCSVSADANVPASLWQQVQQALTGKANLGRSRSAQFGRVSITPNTSATDDLPTSASATTELTLWLLSDLLLEDHGQPCLLPHPHLLSLPAGSRWLSERSFLRSRRYSSYNAFRRRYDSERQVISRGSVLRFELPAPLTSDEITTLQQGLGLHIESGLGRAWINPPLLSSAQPRFHAVATAPEHLHAAAAPPAPDTRLIASLRARQQRRLGDQLPEQAAHSLFAGLRQRIGEARRFAACPRGVAIAAPERSQWGRMKQWASDHRHDAAHLWRLLANDQDGLLRERSGWQLRYGPLAEQTLSQWMLAALQQYSEQPYFSQLIGHLAVLGLQPAWQNCCSGNISEDSAA